MLVAMGITLERAYDGADALVKIAGRTYDLVLVNRVFDADGTSGVEFIGAARREKGMPPLMLVSDYADAQAAAVANGAAPGFGKSQLDMAESLELIRSAIQRVG